MHLLETKLKNQVIEYLRRAYPTAGVYKSADRFTSGIPDLILCVDGKFFAIELKVGRNEPTPIQKFVIKRIRAAGGRVAVCWSLDEVKQFMKGGAT